MRDILISLRRAALLLGSILVLQGAWAKESSHTIEELEELEELWRKELSKNYGPKARRGLVRVLWLRASMEQSSLQFEESLDYFRKAHEFTINAEFPPPDLADFLEAFSEALEKVFLFDEAEKILLQSISQRRQAEAAIAETDPSRIEPWVTKKSLTSGDLGGWDKNGDGQLSRDEKEDARAGARKDLSVGEMALGSLYVTTGRYEEAGRIFHALLGQTGEDHDTSSMVHGKLGRYFAVMGSYAKAAGHYEEARKHALSAGYPEQDPIVIDLTGEIGRVLANNGARDHELARAYLEEAITLSRKLNPSWENKSRLSTHSSNLAQLELAAGNNEQARNIFREILDVYRERFGEDSGYLALHYANLGSADRDLGNYEEALASYRRAADLYRASVGTRYRPYVIAENDYLEIRLRSGASTEETAAQTRELTAQALLLFDDIIAFGTERERLNWLRENQLLNLPCSLGNDPSFIANTILRTKARIIDSLLSEQQDSAGNPERARLRESFERKQRELDHLRFRYEDEDKVSAARGELTALEASLRNTRAGTSTTTVATTWREIQETLPPHSAFVDYVRYSDLNKPEPGNLSYGALLILPEGEPHWIPLGTDRELAIWLSVMKNRLNYRSYLLSTGKTASPPALRMNAALRRLYDLFWAPVAARMPEGTETVGVSPDARLNFVSFAVLLDEKNRFLSEKYRQLVYYASARDLLVEQDLPPLRGGPWSLVAVPEFEAHEGVSDAEKEGTDVLSRVVMDTIEGLADIPGVRQELKLLRKIMPRHREGSFSMNSSEQELRRLSDSPVVLHLATHAFLLPPADQAASAELQDFNQAPDHFYRSGLVLTEAKKAHAARARGDRVPFDRDGVLFSNEVQNLPLQNTRLVTLSSCDSGMGESVRGDGVLGLRRGFTLAGSAAILLSLWPVSDDSTPAFMKHMYQLSLATDQIGQSLWETQRRNLSGIDPSDDAAMEEAILRYGCFVLCQRGPLPAAVEMPEIREPSRTRWALALAIAAVLVFFVTRKWRQEKKA